MTVSAFSIAFLAFGVLTALTSIGVQPWLLALTAIAGIGLVRYAVAFLRVRSRPAHA